MNIFRQLYYYRNGNDFGELEGREEIKVKIIVYLFITAL